MVLTLCRVKSQNCKIASNKTVSFRICNQKCKPPYKFNFYFQSGTLNKKVNCENPNIERWWIAIRKE